MDTAVLTTVAIVEAPGVAPDATIAADFAEAPTILDLIFNVPIVGVGPTSNTRRSSTTNTFIL
jgi:hypothetical protein